jgi:hypothetical protein
MNEPLMRFASIAEAVAHYFDLGFRTVETAPFTRWMEDGTGRAIRVQHQSMLEVLVFEENV